MMQAQMLHMFIQLDTSRKTANQLFHPISLRSDRQALPTAIVLAHYTLKIARLVFLPVDYSYALRSGMYID